MSDGSSGRKSPPKAGRPAGSITQQTIADHLGLDRSTVSLALRNDPRVAVSTLERVRTAARELGYEPALNDAARRLALAQRGKRVLNHVVAIATPSVGPGPYFSTLFAGLAEALADQGYSLLATSYFHSSGEPTYELPPIVRRGEVDGLIMVYDSQEARAQVARLRAARGFGERPIVTVLGVTPGCACVYSDDSLGAYEAARKLLELGHRHCLVQLDREDPQLPATLRFQGYDRAFREQGLDPRRHLHYAPAIPEWFTTSGMPSGGMSRAQARGSALIGCLAAHPEVTAILAANDFLALAVWRTLQVAGLRVPRDLSLVGFDDVELIRGVGGQNVLSSVRVPLQELGREAARLVVRMIEGQADPDTRIVLPTSFMARRSVGLPRSGPLPLR